MKPERRPRPNLIFTVRKWRKSDDYCIILLPFLLVCFSTLYSLLPLSVYINPLPLFPFYLIRFPLLPLSLPFLSPNKQTPAARSSVVRLVISWAADTPVIIDQRGLSGVNIKQLPCFDEAYVITHTQPLLVNLSALQLLVAVCLCGGSISFSFCYNLWDDFTLTEAPEPRPTQLLALIDQWNMRGCRRFTHSTIYLFPILTPLLLLLFASPLHPYSSMFVWMIWMLYDVEKS